jgi:phospholipid-binding lipoprotein MlaA
MSLRRLALLGLLTLAAALGGCASAPPAAGGAAPPAMGQNPADPWEAFNRKVFAFNDAIDEAVLKPVAEGYRKVVPQLVRTGIDNFFGNLGDVWSAANHLLQGKVFSGLDMGMRVLANTTFGLGGILDPATEIGLERRSEDFGQTLGRWGIGPGPYVVLPLWGPRNVRDTAGLVVDRQADGVQLAPTDAGLYALTALNIVHTRANLLGTTQLLGQVALDRYSFVRDGYLARRQDAVYDGAPPAEKFEDFADEPEPKDGSKAKPATPQPRARP